MQILIGLKNLLGFGKTSGAQANASVEDGLTRSVVMMAAGMGATSIGGTFAGNAMSGYVGSAQTEALGAGAVMI